MVNTLNADILKALRRLSSVLWGGPVLVLFLAGGLYLSIRLSFPQLRLKRIALSTLDTLKNSSSPGGQSPFRAFSTSLAAAVGTGSVAGAGAALAVGGPGALFWMWISALIGMALSYCENCLAVQFSSEKSAPGGAYAYISALPKGRTLSKAYALFTVLSSLGMGSMVQSSTGAAAMKNGLGLPGSAGALIILIFTAAALMGTGSAQRLCEKLLPFTALVFVLGSLLILICSPTALIKALGSVFSCAFSPRSAAGGLIGTACIEGLRRGAFSNEAGLGSSPAVHCDCAQALRDPERSVGIMSMAEIFIDTVVICTLTAMVVLVSGVPLDMDCAQAAYGAVLGPAGRVFISLSLTLFALATIAGWSCIGSKAFSYLTGGKESLYSFIYIICVYAGALYSPELIWAVSDVFNALMALPNMAALLCFSSRIKKPFSDSACQ
ncbi:MAG: sodium:alanine symporter family protein [Ruminococcus sp.]|nr:sodium:alanine symporter family protein [Ruminococcus sp.]